jgi:LacI family transcriptional regulator
LKYLAKDTARVALLIETSRSYGRGLLRGVAAYLHTHARWSIWHQERTLNDDAPRWLMPGAVDGVIARLDDARLVRAVRKLDVPVVDLRGRFLLDGIPLIESDDDEIARAAARHLLERGFRSFAFCGYEGANFSDRRLGSFRSFLREEGYDVSVHLAPNIQDGDTRAGEAGSALDERLLASWLREQRHPLGLFCCNDVRGQQALKVCRDQRILVPEQVAVIAVDNDIMLCELCEPTLSSVVPDTEKIGFEAGALLDTMMRGRGPRRPVTYVKPLGVKTRRSSDTLALEDPNVASAVRYIRDHACDGVNVEQVLSRIPVSRSTLERQFKRVLGRTPKAEIQRVRIERVQHLLINTDHPLSAIASMTGFRHPEYLNVAFRRDTGETPIGLRRRHAGEPRRLIDLPRLSSLD